jgi:hypothetical protein
MRAPTEVRPEELREAHSAAETLISERFRSYLPGRMLPMLLAKFHDDVAESLGMELPPLATSCARAEVHRQVCDGKEPRHAHG